MPMSKRRRCFEEGHRRKLLVIVDESPEVETAIYYTASRIAHTSGVMVMLYVIEPQDFQHWMGVRQVQVDEESKKAQAIFRLLRRKIANAGFEDVRIEEIVREGKKTDEITKLIDEDEDIAILVLGASVDAKGPGPLVSSLAGKISGSFPIPINIVPGHLTVDELKAMA